MALQMMAGIGSAVGLVGIFVWQSARNRRRPSAQGVDAQYAATESGGDEKSGAVSGSGAIGIHTANLAAVGRLWRLAFNIGPTEPAVTAADRHIRKNVAAMLQVDVLDRRLFPRRPALLPQLLRALDDPSAAAGRLARIIARDPVLTADLLKLANTSTRRASSVPIDSVQRAIVACGADALRGMLASAIVQPVFRATRRNFPRLPRMLWQRTEHASRAAELYALEFAPEDRFEAQLAVLINALGPLVVYGATLDVYARNPHLKPCGSVCMALMLELAPRMSREVARHWQSSPRLVKALADMPVERLGVVRQVGELVGTLALLESQRVIDSDERRSQLAASGITANFLDKIWPTAARAGRDGAPSPLIHTAMGL